MTGDQTLWWQSGVIYQIYPHSFQDSNGDGIGDLRGIIAQLAYLSWLGVEAVWLSPFYPSPMVDFGYDVSEVRRLLDSYSVEQPRVAIGEMHIPDRKEVMAGFSLPEQKLLLEVYKLWIVNQEAPCTVWLTPRNLSGGPCYTERSPIMGS